MILCSPFIKKSIAEAVLQKMPAGVTASVLTAYKLSAFYRKTSDLGALRMFVANQVDLRSCQRLHAKIYLFDNASAVVTSGNLTEAGLTTNYECGVLITDNAVITQLVSDIRTLFTDDEQARPVTEEIIATTEEILSKVPREEQTRFEKTERQLLAAAGTELFDDLYDGDIAAITESLSGWRKDVFMILLRLPDSVFNLATVYSYTDHFQKIHPDNTEVQAKIRQILQQLRDLGLIEFLGKGDYRKLWK